MFILMGLLACGYFPAVGIFLVDILQVYIQFLGFSSYSLYLLHFTFVGLILSGLQGIIFRVKGSSMRQ
jgi:peptidoglycan/LPS O-acetylase OafA/YrhL